MEPLMYFIAAVVIAAMSWKIKRLQGEYEELQKEYNFRMKELNELSSLNWHKNNLIKEQRKRNDRLQLEIDGLKGLPKKQLMYVDPQGNEISILDPKTMNNEPQWGANEYEHYKSKNK